jgi:hypothetical protein
MTYQVVDDRHAGIFMPVVMTKKAHS